MSSEEDAVEVNEEAAKEETSKIILLGGSDSSDEPKIRKIMLYGEVSEETAKDTIAAMILMSDTAEVEEPVDPEDPESELKKVIQPFEMIVSTHGGAADDMFSVYDMMRYIRETVDIETFGLGKVMSAGTLLLAAGTKGKRKIGKHCRVMIHSVIGGHIGPMHQLDNEMREVRSIQESYIKAICDETNLTEKKLRSILKRKVNVYLTAEEAVEHGFADIIV
jgi:ATP-dependent Clp endopeptidase proteolytic subunit ClpP